MSGVDFSTLTWQEIPVDFDTTWNAATATWDVDGYRLPTEMEWMWAAMGADAENPGATNAIGYMKAFAGSDGTNALGDYAVFGYFSPGVPGRTSNRGSSPVGSKLANELELYDMTGNLYEWIWDREQYGTYPDGPLTDYRGPDEGNFRGYRGGAWTTDPDGCYVALRAWLAPSERGQPIGFRVVRN